MPHNGGRNLVFRWWGAVLIALFLCFTIVPSAGASRSYAAENNNTNPQKTSLVLYISSYSYDWPSVPYAVDGLNSALEGSASIHYLFMNTKNIPVQQAEENLKANLDCLKDSFHYDLAVVGDDDALNFALKYRSEYFNGIPIVFENINTEEKARTAAEDPQITGLLEAFPIKETIEVARKILPHATRVVGISDGTASGLGSSAQFMNCSTDFPDLDFSVMNCSEFSREEIRQQLSSYGEDTILLFLILGKDADGNYYMMKPAVRMITEAAKIPVFKSDEIGIGDGLLGGCVISYQDVGRRAGEMAREILADPKAAAGGFEKSSTRYLFDAKVMQRFHIRKALLPSSAGFVNETPSFWENYKTVLLPVCIIIVLLFALLMLAMVGSYRRKVLNRKLLENEKTMKTALDNSNVVLFRFDQVTRVAEFENNVTGYKIFDSKIENFPDPILEKDMIHPEDKPLLRAVMKKMEKGAGSGTCEYRLKWPDGYRWQLMKLSDITDENGKRIRIVGTTIDIDEHKKAELEYANQLKYISQASDDNLTAKARYNLTRNKVEFFEDESGVRIESLQHLSYDDCLKKLVSLVITEEDRRQLFANLNRDILQVHFSEGRNTCSYDYQWRDTYGENKWSNVNYRLFTEPATDDLVCFAFSYDITEQMVEREIVKRITNVEFDYLALIDIATRRIMIHNVKQGIQTVVPEKVMNYEDFNASMNRHVRPEDIPNVAGNVELENILKNLNENGSFMFSFSVYDGDGSESRKKIQYAYLDESHETILLCRSDITDIYQLEKKHLHMIEDALRKAEIANSAKTDFLSKMSHDIRTPLNAILGLTVLTAEHTENPVLVKDSLSKIYSSGKLLLGLINDVLDMSKIESGKMELHPEPYPFAEFKEMIVSMFAPLCQKKNILFSANCNFEELTLMVDRVRFNQIFCNLLSNAVKFTAQGSVTFEADGTLAKNNRLEADFMVRDTGCGMSMEFQKSMFQPFTQESAANRPNENGTGLGLSIAKSIADLMGGTISVQSMINEGTTITVHLSVPVVEGKLADHAAKAEEDPDGDFLKGKRVLLAEDHPLNTEIAVWMLGNRGILTEHAENGERAVQMFEQNEEQYYDAILMDIRMPVMNGLSAAENIRAIASDYARNIPIIAMTANAFEEDVNRSLKAGMNAHLTKPIEPDRLYSTLAEQIRKFRNIG